MKINVWQLTELSRHERETLMRRSETEIEAVAPVVAAIIAEVKAKGDAALKRYAAEFDGAVLDHGLQVTRQEFQQAYAELDGAVLEAIKHCADNVRRHHQQQRARVDWQWLQEVRPGVFAGEKITPTPSVGLYVPRGKGAFPSVMYMLCLPAVVAGVPKIVVCTPPGPSGAIDPASLVAADLCGVHTIYKVGGAQAIAALALGTETVTKVAQVNGPGNAYVSAAKNLLAHLIDAGLPSGPSEAIILADETADPWNTALDLINEAEHGPDSASLLVTPSRALADRVIAHLTPLVASLPSPRREYCERVFANYGGVLLCSSLGEAIEFCNDYAAEHLLLKVAHIDHALAQLRNCGEILIGDTTPIVLGNYGIGSNAVLPTGGKAKTHDCTSIWSFLKRTGLAYVTTSGYRALKEPVIRLAHYEGFPGHAKVLEERREQGFADIALPALGGECPPR